MSTIDITKPVFFYDDRGKSDVDYRLVEVLYADDAVCLCIAAPIVRMDIPLGKEIHDNIQQHGDLRLPTGHWLRDVTRERVLFSLADGEVLSTNLAFWCATDDATIGDHFEDGDANAQPELCVV